jgi:hypothetical protein
MLHPAPYLSKKLAGPIATEDGDTRRTVLDAYAKSFEDVWFATPKEIAEWYLKNHHCHIA